MSSKISAQRAVLIFWGIMDAICIGVVLASSMFRGGVPILSDLDAALSNARNWGDGAEILVWLGLMTQLSVVVTGVLFFYGVRAAVYLAMLQFPFRIFFNIPSVSSILFGATLLPEISIWVWVFFRLLSEVLKGWSLWWLHRSFSTSDVCPGSNEVIFGKVEGSEVRSSLKALLRRLRYWGR